LRPNAEGSLSHINSIPFAAIDVAVETGHRNGHTDDALFLNTSAGNTTSIHTNTGAKQQHIRGSTGVQPPPPPPQDTNVWGTGFTPEGIDQNPVYYEFMLEANWRTHPVENITEHIIIRSHRRYGLVEEMEEVATAWALLVASAYSQDLQVNDGTGVTHFGRDEGWAFESDRHTPTQTMCQIYNAWDQLVHAGIKLSNNAPGKLMLETFRCVACLCCCYGYSNMLFELNMLFKLRRAVCALSVDTYGSHILASNCAHSNQLFCVITPTY
jgi:hypothetical protein